MRDHRIGEAWRALRGLPTHVLVGAIRGYQLLISPMSIGQCKYYPTCSAYAVTAIRRYGAVKGVGLALWRLARCNPWSRGGVDHVPARSEHDHETYRHRHDDDAGRQLQEAT